MTTAPHRLLIETFFQDGLLVTLTQQQVAQPFQLHWHEFYELTLVLQGTGVNTVNGERHLLNPGDAFLLTPADFHAIAPDPGQVLVLYNLIFAQAMLSDTLVQLLFPANAGVTASFNQPADFERMVLHFKNLERECQMRAPGRDIAVQSELNLILIEWQRHRKAQTPVATSDKTLHHRGIQKALIYIQHHFRQAISLNDAAQHANLSANYFSELFGKETGISFQQYVQQLRLQFAMALLKTSHLQVTEVSYASGFNTLTHFERVFRLQFGMTPREARGTR